MVHTYIRTRALPRLKLKAEADFVKLGARLNSIDNHGFSGVERGEKKKEKEKRKKERLCS